MKNRLQFNYYMPASFPYTREKAVLFIENLFSKNTTSQTSLPAEPVVVFYGEEAAESSVLIAIGRGGDGKDILNNVPYYLIDYTQTTKDIENLFDEVDSLKKIDETLNLTIVEINNNIDEIKRNAIRIEDKFDAEVATLNDKINAETERATGVEHDIVVMIHGESDRAKIAEKDLQNNIDVETTRAEGVENEIRTYAEGVDQRLTETIASNTNDHTEIRTALYKETDRATTREDALSGEITNEVNRALKREGEINDRLSTAIANIDSAKASITTNKVMSTNKTLSVVATDGIGTDLSVNVDQKTIIIDPLTGKLSVDANEIRQPISPEDKILTNDENGLHAHLSLKWVKSTDGSKNDEIQLIGKNGVISSIDVADFIKDGILNGVKLETREGVTYIVFTFNTGEVIELDVKNLIDVYTAGDGLQLVENVFSIKRDPLSDNFLTVSPDGIKISGIQTAIEDANMGLTNAIASVDAKVNVLNGSVETPGSVKQILSQTIIANEVTDITPENVSGQTLLRRVATSGSIYASNRALDIIYEAEDGNTSNVNILLRNLLSENAVLKEKVARLESIEYKEQLFTEFANRIYNGMEGVAMEIGVNKKYDINNTNITGVEIGFADDALFQAGV